MPHLYTHIMLISCTSCNSKYLINSADLKPKVPEQARSPGDSEYSSEEGSFGNGVDIWREFTQAIDINHL